MIDDLIPETSIQQEGTIFHLVAIDRGRDLNVSLEPGPAQETLLRNCEDAYGFPPYPALERFLPFWNGEDLREREREIIRVAMSRCPATLIQSESRNWWQYLPGILGSVHTVQDKAPGAELAIRSAPRLDLAEQWALVEPSQTDTNPTIYPP